MPAFSISTRSATCPRRCCAQAATGGCDVPELRTDRSIGRGTGRSPRRRAAPRDIDLPDDFIAPSAQGILRRLALYWGHSGKRRFSRRRQNYRAVLCIGLQALWQLFTTTKHRPAN